MATILTEAFIRTVKFDGKPKEYRDTKIPGLILYVGSLKKTYSWKCEVNETDAEGNRKKRYAKGLIGDQINLSLDQARRIAYQRITEARARAVTTSEARSDTTLKQLLDLYVDDLRRRGRSKHGIKENLKAINRYFPLWLNRNASEITRSEMQAGHKRVSEENGKVSANHAMRFLRAAYNVFIRTLPDAHTISNPVDAVRLNKEAPKRDVIEDLASWYSSLNKIKNPIRYNCHLFGLLSGLRPGNRIAIRNEWIDFKDSVINFPASVMKNRSPFSLKLSGRMLDLVRDTQEIAFHLYGSDVEWLFPTLNREGEVSSIAEWKEPRVKLPTGHQLRRTYRSIALLIGIQSDDAEILISHRLPSIKEAYIDRIIVTPRLRLAQHKITETIAALLIGAKILPCDHGELGLSLSASPTFRLHRIRLEETGN